MSYWHHFFGCHSNTTRKWPNRIWGIKIHFLSPITLFGFSSEPSCLLCSWMMISSASKAAFANWDFSSNTMILKSAMFSHMLVSLLSCMPPVGSSHSLRTNAKLLTSYVSSGLKWFKSKITNSFSHFQLPWLCIIAISSCSVINLTYQHKWRASALLLLSSWRRSCILHKRSRTLRQYLSLSRVRWTYCLERIHNNISGRWPGSRKFKCISVSSKCNACLYP